MITRERAWHVLYNVINSGIISEELENDLQDIANAIDLEQMGFHMWGASDDEVVALVASRNMDAPDYPAYLEKRCEIAARRRFTPSAAEGGNNGK